MSTPGGGSQFLGPDDAAHPRPPPQQPPPEFQQQFPPPQPQQPIYRPPSAGTPQFQQQPIYRPPSAGGGQQPPPRPPSAGAAPPQFQQPIYRPPSAGGQPPYRPPSAGGQQPPYRPPSAGPQPPSSGPSIPNNFIPMSFTPNSHTKALDEDSLGTPVIPQAMDSPSASTDSSDEEVKSRGSMSTLTSPPAQTGQLPPAPASVRSPYSAANLSLQSSWFPTGVPLPPSTIASPTTQRSSTRPSSRTSAATKKSRR